MASDEIDFDQAKPIQLSAEVSPEKIVSFFAGEEQSKLQPKEITEEMLEKLYENLKDLEHLSKMVEMQKADVKALGKGLETIAKGRYVAMFKAVKGRRSVNWKKLTAALIGKISDEDMEKFSEEGEPSVRLEIRRLDA